MVFLGLQAQITNDITYPLVSQKISIKKRPSVNIKKKSIKKLKAETLRSYYFPWKKILEEYLRVCFLKIAEPQNKIRLRREISMKNNTYH